MKVRLIGIQAMELSSYSRKRGRAGECHSVEATKRLQGPVRGARRRVWLTALHENSSTGKRRRLRRHVAIRHRGRWVDLGGVLLPRDAAQPARRARRLPRLGRPTLSRRLRRAAPASHSVFDRIDEIVAAGLEQFA